jgi:hypothetical protein
MIIYILSICIIFITANGDATCYCYDQPVVSTKSVASNSKTVSKLQLPRRNARPVLEQ